MPALFDDIQIGQVEYLGECIVEPEALDQFIRAFAPGWTPDRGAPDTMTFAIWSKLDGGASARWPQTKRIGVDALRWVRNPPAGDILRARMTIMGKDPVGEDKGIVFVREPKAESYGTVAVFEDLYGNLWDLIQTNTDGLPDSRNA